MKPGYRLALELGIPVVLQPEWDKCRKLWERGEKLWKQYHEKMATSTAWITEKQKVIALWEEGWALHKKSEEMYTKAVLHELGGAYIKHINWNTGEIKE